MRKSAWLIFGFCLLIGCGGCRQAGADFHTAQPVATGFSCMVQGQYGEWPVAGRMERSGAGMLTLTLSEPEAIAGVTLQWDGVDMTAEWHGVSWSLDASKVPQAALGRGVLESLDAVVYGTADCRASGDRLTVTGQTDGGTFTLTVDAATGVLQSLTVPEQALTLTFSDFQLTA